MAAPQRADTTDYEALFRSGVALLDTRAPVEFARGSFPTAFNLPLMTDDERAAVGTCYKERGQAAAIALGHELVAGATREARIDAWLRFAKENPDGYLYCFRGGLRSQLVQAWLAERSVAYPRVGGGYKAMRRFLIETLEEKARAARLLLVAGATGTGKTRVIQALERAIDLEGLARHRGSAFGRMLEEQPTQIDFENALAIELLQKSTVPGSLVLEDEGRLIGRVALPEALRENMEQAPLLLIEEPIAARVQIVIEDYILDLGERYAAVWGTDGPARHRQRLLDDLARTRKRLGGERHDRVAALMETAFDEQQRSGGSDAHAPWIQCLLQEYYDPMYRYQLDQRRGQRIFRGSRDEVIARARELTAC